MRYRLEIWNGYAWITQGRYETRSEAAATGLELWGTEVEWRTMRDEGI